MQDKRKYADRREYLRQAVALRRKRVKIRAVEYKGGKCQICSYNKCNRALEFHHLDASKKDFGISYKGHSKAWHKVRAELDKCILVCSNCHQEIHDGITQLP